MEDNDKRRAGLRRHAETKSEIYSKNEAESAPKGRILSLVVFFWTVRAPPKNDISLCFAAKVTKLCSVFLELFICV